MIKISRHLTLMQAKELIRHMPISQKIKLARELQQETWAKQLEDILKGIDRRRRKLKISGKEISQEIEKARKEFYAQRRR